METRDFTKCMSIRDRDDIIYYIVGMGGDGF